MVADGRIHLPLALDAKAHRDFELTIDWAGPNGLHQALEARRHAGLMCELI
jgi:hypothetical protein